MIRSCLTRTPPVMVRLCGARRRGPRVGRTPSCSTAPRQPVADQLRRTAITGLRRARSFRLEGGGVASQRDRTGYHRHHGEWQHEPGPSSDSEVLAQHDHPEKYGDQRFANQHGWDRRL